MLFVICPYIYELQKRNALIHRYENSKNQITAVYCLNVALCSLHISERTQRKRVVKVLNSFRSGEGQFYSTE